MHSGAIYEGIERFTDANPSWSPHDPDDVKELGRAIRDVIVASDLPAWMSSEDAKLTLETRILTIVSSYGGETIVAGSRMEQLNRDLYNLVLSNDTAQLVNRIVPG